MSTVSFIIPCFNHADYLAEAVESALAQSFRPLEIVIVDDASTDASRTVAKALASCHPEIVVLTNDRNQGCERSSNRGLAHARGDYVVFRAADDVSLPGFLARAVAMLDANPAVPFCCGDTVYFLQNPQRGRREQLGRSPEPVLVPPSDFLRLYGGNIIHGATTLSRRSAVLAAGGMDPELRWHSDWFLYLQLGLEHGFAYVPAAFSGTRLNAASYNATGTGDSARQTDVLLHLLGRLDATPVLRERMLEIGCLDFFGEPLRRLLATAAPSRRRCLAPLLAPPRPEITEARAVTGLASVFRSFLQQSASLIRRHAGRTAIYGAGGHTRQLLAVWRELALPPPVLLLDGSARPNTADAEFEGLPVRPPAALAALADPLVVLSSKSYEPLFAQTLDTQFPEVPYLRVWGADLLAEPPPSIMNPIPNDTARPPRDSV